MDEANLGKEFGLNKEERNLDGVKWQLQGWSEDS